MSKRRADSDDDDDSCVLLGTPLVDLMPGKQLHPSKLYFK